MRQVAEYENCRLLLVDKKITTARDVVGILEASMRGGYPLLIMAEDIEQEPLATLVVNKLRGNLKVIAVKAPGFGERKSSYLEDIAIMTGGTVVKDELGISLDKVSVSGSKGGEGEPCRLVSAGITDLPLGTPGWRGGARQSRQDHPGQGEYDDRRRRQHAGRGRGPRAADQERDC